MQGAAEESPVTEWGDAMLSEKTSPAALWHNKKYPLLRQKTAWNNLLHHKPKIS